MPLTSERLLREDCKQRPVSDFITNSQDHDSARIKGHGFHESGGFWSLTFISKAVMKKGF